MRTTRSLVLLTLLAVGCGSSSSPSDAAISEAGTLSEAGTFSEAGSLADVAISVNEAGGLHADVIGSVSEAGRLASEAGGSISEAGGSVSEAGGLLPDGAAMTDAGAATAYCTSKPALTNVPDLSGVWVAKLTGAQIVTSGFTSPIHNQNVYYQLLTVEQAGNSITIDGRYCDRTEVNDPNASVPVLIPDAWAHTETVVHRTGEITPSATGYSVLTLPELDEVIGANLASATDALPTAADDPRVYDEDSDGQPGITIRLGGALNNGSVYSVQSQATTVNAVAVSSSRLEGALTFTSNQTVLASNPSTIKGLYAASKTSPDFAVCASTFVMVKVAAADVPTCASLRANEAMLFK